MPHPLPICFPHRCCAVPRAASRRARSRVLAAPLARWSLGRTCRRLGVVDPCRSSSLGWFWCILLCYDLVKCVENYVDLQQLWKLSRFGSPDWETGTTRVSQMGQIVCSIAVFCSLPYSEIYTVELVVCMLLLLYFSYSLLFWKWFKCLVNSLEK